LNNKIVTHFYLKEAKTNRKGLAPIYLRITVNGERADISINKKINPENWDKNNERAHGRTESARTINAYLDTLNGKVRKYFSTGILNTPYIVSWCSTP
jgi:hypothetical protein